MERDEVKEIFDVLMKGYPEYYAKRSQEELQGLIDFWQVMTDGFDKRMFLNGVKTTLLTHTGYNPPTIGQIVSNIKKFSVSSDLDALTAWDNVLSASRDSTFHSKERFESLDNQSKAVLVNHERLKYIGNLEYGYPLDQYKREFVSLYNQKKEKQLNNALIGIVANDNKMIEVKDKI